MLVSNERKFVYIHVPRTAGIAMRRTLFANKIDFAHQVPDNDLHPYHATADQVKALIGDDKWHEYFTFAFVRNPWERLVSRYCHVWSSKCRFAEYLTIPDIMCPQVEVIGDVEFVGRYEHLQRDWQYVIDRLKLYPVLSRDNRSVHSDYRDYYTGKTKKLVAERHRPDIERFGYTF